MEEEKKEEIFQTPPQFESNFGRRGNSPVRRVLIILISIIVIGLIIFGVMRFFGGETEVAELADQNPTPLGKKIKSSFKKAKEKLTHEDETYIKLAELVEGSRILFRASTVFPFDFFPDELIIDRDKVSIITKYFVASSTHQSILIKNISDVYVDTSVFFATLKIVDKYFSNNIFDVNYLKKNEAIYARNIIQGLIICHENKVDISNMKRKDLLLYLEEIGKATAK